ncbi:retropepsin-like aspartic protease family protein [Sphingomonas glaciei]|uniref:TIGR02281 family clan AA aspartic protease n=1 Tax=Sphingomonas glaciei TaxID=2938948 RepID=A0ABY5MZD7_9SPHN|nr:TIGR02281 family clan AA aspartic protease [Sphingomonas glaciei]UUR08672.1 TIGR02281 family clan AA aspartic protease [Sphingomonas glaciei]
MVTNDLQLGGLYLLMAVMLVAGALIGRRAPLAKGITSVLAFLVIFGAGFIVFSFRDDLNYVAQRLEAEATGKPVQLAGDVIRVPLAVDGHFWIQAEVNGVPVDFLIDSGATMTTVGRKTAALAGLPISDQRNQLVRTGNGLIRVASGRADTVSVGDIERRNVRMFIADGDELNVLGMNYLTSLTRWSVEGRWLVLEG